MQPTARASAWALLGLLLVSVLWVSLPVSAQSPGVGVMQAEDPKNLTYEQNRMFLYGSNDGGGRQDTWPMWTHSANSDIDSDDSLGEGNLVGDPNNGGGARTFTWEGSNPPAEDVAIDPAVPIVGQIKLDIICNWEQDTCSKQINIVLRLGNRDLAQVTIDTPDADDVYAFEFYHNIDTVPAGETFGMRMSFQKPNGMGDGYTLYLGQGNSFMDIPVLPPYEEAVPGLDVTDGYKSPYSMASGFTTEAANVTSWAGLIFWCLVSVGIFVGGFSLLPAIPFKEVTILLTGMGLLGSMFVAPLISGPVLTGMAANPDDPDIWTAEEIAQLEEREGTFLGDALTEGYSFTFYAEYDEVYTTKHEGVLISALGFEGDEEILGDPEVSRRGREYVQLFFSAFHADLRPGQAVLAEITIVNESGVFLPSHAVNPTLVPVTIDGDTSARFTIPHEVCTLVGGNFDWQYYPVLVTAVGLLLGGVSFWQVYRSSRDAWEEEMYDEDLEDALDESEDDFDDDLDDL